MPGLVALVLSVSGFAQSRVGNSPPTYPSKSIRLVHGYAWGTPGDFARRLRRDYETCGKRIRQVGERIE